eukprot:SAG11_NODE_5814_length_1457_cov_1.453274_1_plen_22_part_01
MLNSIAVAVTPTLAAAFAAVAV